MAAYLAHIDATLSGDESMGQWSMGQTVDSGRTVGSDVAIKHYVTGGEI